MEQNGYANARVMQKSKKIITVAKKTHTVKNIVLGGIHTHKVNYLSQTYEGRGDGLETPAGIYHGDCRSRTAAAQRVPGDRKSHVAYPDQRSCTLERWRAQGPSPTSARSWASKRWRKWRRSSSPTPFSVGTASSWPRSLMAPHSARLPVAP